MFRFAHGATEDGPIEAHIYMLTPGQLRHSPVVYHTNRARYFNLNIDKTWNTITVAFRASDGSASTC